MVTPVRIRNVPISSGSLTQGHDHAHHAGAGDRASPWSPKKWRCWRGHGLEVRDHLRGAFGPPGGRSVAAVRSRRRAGLVQSLPRLAKAALGEDARPPRTRLPGAGKAKTVNRTKSETPAKDPAARDITPGLDPMAQIRFMEVMIGK